MVRPFGRAKLVSYQVAGRLVEMGGNHVTIKGLEFSVDNALITTRDKGRLDAGLPATGEIGLALRVLVPDLPVVELGGGIGVVSCLINRGLTRPDRHIVVEANPDLIPTLETNRRLNACQFRIRNAALAYEGTEATLAVDSFVSSRIGGEGRRVRVPTTTLANLLEDTTFRRVNLVVDIEGAEADLVEREGRLLACRARTLIVETHPRFVGREATAHMLGTLRTLGFVEVARARDVFAFEHPATK
jgi:FkbM family methyltransferase